MKNCLKILSFASILVLTACANNAVEQTKMPEKTMKTVTYLCGAKHNQPMQVSYSFEGKKAVDANVKFAGKIYANMIRVKAKNDVTQFENADKWAWLVDNIDLDNVMQKDGMMLMQRTAEADKILVNYCIVKK